MADWMKKNQILPMIFFVAMFLMYFMRYFSHEMVLDAPGYRSIAMAGTASYIACIFLFFWGLLRKAPSEGRFAVILWMGLYAGVNFGTFVPRNMLGSVFLYLAFLYFLMMVCAVTQRCLWLLPVFYVTGIYLYPGFYLLAMPLFLSLPTAKMTDGTSGLKEKAFQISSLVALILGALTCLLRILFDAPLTDAYGVMQAVGRYGDLYGLFENRGMRLVEGASFLLFLLPILLLVRRRKKTWRFLFPFFPILIEAITQVHLGVCVYYFVVGALGMALFQMRHSTQYAERVNDLIRSIKAYPGGYILYLYPFALTPLFMNHICKATQWIGETVLFLFSTL